MTQKHVCNVWSSVSGKHTGHALECSMAHGKDSILMLMMDDFGYYRKGFYIFGG